MLADSIFTRDSCTAGWCPKLLGHYLQPGDSADPTLIENVGLSEGLSADDVAAHPVSWLRARRPPLL